MTSIRLAPVVCAAVATTCAGAVRAVFAPYGTPNDGQGAAGYGDLTGYSAWRVSLVADRGETIISADFSGQDDPEQSFRLPLHQYWTLNNHVKTGFVSVAAKTPYSTGTSNQSASPDFFSAYDSHFIFDGAKGLITLPFTEDNDVSLGSGASGQGGSPLSALYNVNPVSGTPSDGWGGGTYLSGAWAIAEPYQSNRLDVAYLVIPDSPSLLARIWAIPTITTDAGSFRVLVTPFPEPGTFGGVVLCVASGCRRRCRGTDKRD